MRHWNLIRLLAAGIAWSVLLTSCRVRPPPTLESPGLEREKARKAESRRTHFHLGCPGGEPRVGTNCGLLAYYWFSEASTLRMRRKCGGSHDPDCGNAFFREYLSAVAKRYEAVGIGVIDRACMAQREELDCLHPLLYETLYLLAHNLTRERFPDARYDVVSAADQRAIDERQAAIAGELTEFIADRLSVSHPGLPDQSCPQRVFGDVECEGRNALLNARWRSQQLVFEVE